MNPVKILRAAPIVVAGLVALAGAAAAAPALDLPAAAQRAATAGPEATPVYYGHGPYGPYYQSHYRRPYYQPQYAPGYGYAPYGYAPYAYGPPRYHGRRHWRRHHHGGIYIRTPGLRLGIGF